MSPAAAQQKKILIIEDDKGINNGLQIKFQKLGFKTDVCFDGEQGLKKMNEETFEGIMVDLMMPIKDGFEVLSQKGGTKNGSTPIYVLTALGSEKQEHARKLGARMIFSKSDRSAAEVVNEIQKDLALKA
ncbi:TPA: response regulator transcription factor [Candidatus Micrarchaeota archaeon]|nr:response regulator transcription factor [Candidatus Micrarchaeota archaeon]